MDTTTSETYTVPIWIEGQVHSIDTDDIFPVVHRTSGKTLHLAANANLDIVKSATDSAWNALQSWKRTLHTRRRDLLSKFADILERDSDKFVQSIVEETLCPPSFAKFTHDEAVTRAKDAAALLYSVVGPLVTIGQSDRSVSMQPVGSVLLIPSWKTPTFLAVRAISQAIGAGCSVVLKASKSSPRSHFMIVEALTEAGAPPGLLNSLQAKPEDDKNITNALISDKRIRKVDFIGSVTSGRVIASLCGACLKPCTLELEGKCPALIMEDVDIPVAAALCVQRSMMYHGQVGMNKDCMIVQETVVAQFKEAFFQALKSTPVVQDNPINKESAEKAHQVICDPELIGYQFVLGKPGFKSAASWAPIIVLSPKGSKIQDEKVLGPTVSLCIVENEKEAVELANETEYGYYAAIYTRDMVQADRMARELDYGIVHCNNSQCFTYSNALTGGRCLLDGSRAMKEFVVEKTFTYKISEMPDLSFLK